MARSISNVKHYYDSCLMFTIDGHTINMWYPKNKLLTCTLILISNSMLKYYFWTKYLFCSFVWTNDNTFGLCCSHLKWIMSSSRFQNHLFIDMKISDRYHLFSKCSIIKITHLCTNNIVNLF